jgi:hypothetical protein
MVAVCFGQMPGAWTGNGLASFPTIAFHAAAVTPAGDRAFGFYQTSADKGLALLNLTTGDLSKIVTFPPDASGLSSLAVDPPWVAWTQGDSKYNLGAWTIYARNLDSGESVKLATSRLDDGSYVFGQVPLVAVRKGVVGWAQPTSKTGPNPQAEVRLYDLVEHKQTVIDSGRVSSPVFAGHDIVWARIGDDLKPAFRALDVETRQPVQLPPQLQDQPAIVYLAGSPRYLAWTTSNQEVRVWQVDTSDVAAYSIQDNKNPLQFLTLAGHYLLWYTGYPYAVLDLNTGGAFDVSGAVAGSEAAIVTTETLRAPATKTDIPGTGVSTLRTASAPGIPGC